MLEEKPFGFGRAIKIDEKQNRFLYVLRVRVLGNRGQMASLEFCGGGKKDFAFTERHNSSFSGFITEQGGSLWLDEYSKRFVSAVTNFENKFKNNFLDMVIRNPIAQTSMFYGRQEMDAMHFIPPDSSIGFGGESFYTDVYRSVVHEGFDGDKDHAEVTQNIINSTRWMVATYYRPDLLRSENPPSDDCIEFFLAINDTLNDEQKINLRYILTIEDTSKLSKKQLNLRKKILGDDEKSKKYRADVVNNWKNSFKNLEVENSLDGKIGTFKCDKRQLSYIMSRDASQLTDKQKKFRDDFAKACKSQGLYSGRCKLTVTHNNYKDYELEQHFDELVEITSQDFSKLKSEFDLCKTLENIKKSTVENFFDLSFDDKNEIVSAMLKDPNKPKFADYFFEDDKNKKQLFKLFEEIAKKDGNSKVYVLIENKKLGEEAIKSSDKVKNIVFKEMVQKAVENGNFNAYNSIQDENLRNEALNSLSLERKNAVFEAMAENAELKGSFEDYDSIKDENLRNQALASLSLKTKNAVFNKMAKNAVLKGSFKDYDSIQNLDLKKEAMESLNQVTKEAVYKKIAEDAKKSKNVAIYNDIKDKFSLKSGAINYAVNQAGLEGIKMVAMFAAHDCSFEGDEGDNKKEICDYIDDEELKNKAKEFVKDKYKLFALFAKIAEKDGNIYKIKFFIH